MLLSDIAMLLLCGGIAGFLAGLLGIGGGMILVQMGRRNFELSINSKEIKEAGIKLAPLVLELVINN